jgi:hypothetical protein
MMVRVRSAFVVRLPGAGKNFMIRVPPFALEEALAGAELVPEQAHSGRGFSWKHRLMPSQRV